MKLSLKITGIFLIFSLLTSCVAATENKDLPTKKEITDFITGIPVSENYIITLFDAVKDRQPSWNCDVWEDKNGNQILSLYYLDPDSAKGYGCIYLNELGKEISIRGVEVVVVKSYIGESVSEASTTVDATTADTTTADTTTADTTTGSTEKQSVENEQLNEYEKQLAEYEERLNKYDEASQSVDNESQLVGTVAYKVDNMSQTVYEGNQSDEYKKLLDELKGLQAEYPEAESAEKVATKAEEKETKWNAKIVIFLLIVVTAVLILTNIIKLTKKSVTNFLLTVVGGLIMSFIAYKYGLI